MKIFKAAQYIINSTPGDFFGSEIQQGVVLVRLFQPINLSKEYFLVNLLWKEIRPQLFIFYV